MEVRAVDTSKATALINDLVAVTGRPRILVIKSEITKVLELCVKRSPGKEDTDEVRRKTRLRVEKPARYVSRSGTLIRERLAPRGMGFGLQTLTGTRGGTEGAQYLIQRDRHGKRFFLRFMESSPVSAKPLSRWNRSLYHGLDSISRSIFHRMQPRVATAIAAIGAMRKSWLQIAQKLGLDLQVKGYVRQSLGKYDDGARSLWVMEGESYFAECVNSNSLLVRKYNAAAIVAAALETRRAAFGHQLRTGVFDDVKRRAKLYPGIYTTD